MPGPGGPTGAASTVAGPRGPTGAASTVPGPRGPTGADSTVAGPRGATGSDGNDANAFKWQFGGSAGGGGYGQYTSGKFIVRTSSGYTGNKYGIESFWINKNNTDGTLIATGPPQTLVQPTGWFGLWSWRYINT